MDMRKILVMDDEDLIRTVAGKMLEFLGYLVVTAKNGEEAIALFDSHRAAGTPFDAVVLDWIVQDGMNGAETIAALLRIDPNVKCLLSSGIDRIEAFQKGSELGFLGNISKPYDMKGLESALKNLLTTPTKPVVDLNPQ